MTNLKTMPNVLSSNSAQLKINSIRCLHNDISSTTEFPKVANSDSKNIDNDKSKKYNNRKKSNLFLLNESYYLDLLNSYSDVNDMFQELCRIAYNERPQDENEVVEEEYYRKRHYKRAIRSYEVKLYGFFNDIKSNIQTLSIPLIDENRITQKYIIINILGLLVYITNKEPDFFDDSKTLHEWLKELYKGIINSEAFLRGSLPINPNTGSKIDKYINKRNTELEIFKLICNENQSAKKIDKWLDDHRLKGIIFTSLKSKNLDFNEANTIRYSLLTKLFLQWHTQYIYFDNDFYKWMFHETNRLVEELVRNDKKIASSTRQDIDDSKKSYEEEIFDVLTSSPPDIRVCFETFSLKLEYEIKENDFNKVNSDFFNISKETYGKIFSASVDLYHELGVINKKWFNIDDFTTKTLSEIDIKNTEVERIVLESEKKSGKTEDINIVFKRLACYIHFQTIENYMSHYNHVKKEKIHIEETPILTTLLSQQQAYASKMKSKGVKYILNFLNYRIKNYYPNTDYNGFIK